MTLDINTPPPGQVIRDLYVWIATFPDGTEGIIVGNLPEVGATPLVTGRLHNAQLMERFARRAVAQLPGTTARLVTFTTTEGTRQ